jgi:hypothetical protein
MLLDTREQVLRFLDTVMYSDNEDMRLGAYNRVAIHIKQMDAEIDAAKTVAMKLGRLQHRSTVDTLVAKYHTSGGDDS